MSRKIELYLEDILEAAEKVITFTKTLEFESFTTNELVVDAVLHNLMIIGEAVKNIPDELRQQKPEVEWKYIGRFRDLVVHHYFAIKLNVVWNIIRNDLPTLQEQIKTLLDQHKSEDDE